MRKPKVKHWNHDYAFKLPEVVLIDNCTEPQMLMLFEDGKVYMVRLDGMSSAPLDHYERIIPIPRKRQLKYLAKTYFVLLRKLAFIGDAPGCREMRRMCTLAVGLRWKEPKGTPISGGTFLTVDEAIRRLADEEARQSSKAEEHL